MRILGLDVGDKTLGVAVSDGLGLTAQGIETIHRKNLAYDIERLKKLIEEYEVHEIVLGLPRNMNGTLGPQAKKVKSLGEDLKAIFKLPVNYWDERLSTLEAEKILISQDVSRKKRKKVIDKLAAVVILQGYLDRNAFRA